MAIFPTDPTAARTELLTRLPACGFVPPAEWADAARGHAEPPTDPALRGDIDAFATAFWALAPAVRRARWQALLDRAANERSLAARLRRLEAGVDLEAVPAGGDCVTVLALHVQSLYFLKPEACVARRAVLTRSIFWPVSDWEAAAQTLGRQWPSLAALDPVVQRLAEASERSQTLERGRRRVRTAAQESPTKNQGMSVLITVSVVLSLLGRLISGCSSQPDAARYVSPPVHRPYETPRYRPGPPTPFGPGNSAEPTDDLSRTPEWLRISTGQSPAAPPAPPKESP